MYKPSRNNYRNPSKTPTSKTTKQTKSGRGGGGMGAVRIAEGQKSEPSAVDSFLNNTLGKNFKNRMNRVKEGIVAMNTPAKGMAAVRMAEDKNPLPSESGGGMGDVRRFEGEHPAEFPTSPVDNLLEEPAHDPSKYMPKNRPALNLGGIRPNFRAIQGNLKRQGLETTLNNLRGRFGNDQAQEYIRQATGLDPSDPTIGAAINKYRDRTANVTMPQTYRPNRVAAPAPPPPRDPTQGPVQDTSPVPDSRFENIDWHMGEMRRGLDKFGSTLNSAIDQNRKNINAFPDPNRPLIPQEYGMNLLKRGYRAARPVVSNAVDWLIGNR